MALKKITLREWIEEVGRAEVAKLMRVHRTNVDHWKYGRSLPHGEQMVRIEKYTKGRLTCGDMVRHKYGAKPAQRRAKKSVRISLK